MGFSQFIDEIPSNIHAQTRTFITDNLAIFRPAKYFIERQMIMVDYHFVLFRSISPEVRIDGKEYKFRKGSLISLQPGTEIFIKSDEANTISHYILISVKKNYIEQIAQRVLENKNIIFSKLENRYSTQLIGAINNLELELLSFGHAYSIMINNLREQIVFLLLRDSMPDTLGNRIGTNSDDDCLIKAIEFMRENFCGDITIEDICKEIYLSTSYFKRMFKSRTGTTPYKYLMQLRIDTAKKTIENDFFSIDETASRCGFSNSGHLSTVFKKLEGIPPSEFRRRIKDAKASS